MSEQIESVSENKVGEVAVVRKPRIHVSREVFITAWEQSKSSKEVAQKLNMNIQSVLQRVSKMRKEDGIPLKKMEWQARTKKSVNVQADLALLAKIRGTTVESLV